MAKETDYGLLESDFGLEGVMMTHSNTEGLKRAWDDRQAKIQPAVDKIIEAAENRGFTSLVVTVGGAQHSRDMVKTDNSSLSNPAPALAVGYSDISGPY